MMPPGRLPVRAIESLPTGLAARRVDRPASTFSPCSTPVPMHKACQLSRATPFSRVFQDFV
jgi:hypothetical protein